MYSGTSGHSVLIVDDERQVQEMLADALSPDYACETADSAEEALSLVSGGRRYDLLISDVQMGGMSGIDLIPHVRRFDPALPILIQTGLDSRDTAVAALRAGASDLILKPFSVTALREATERAFCDERTVATWRRSAVSLLSMLGFKHRETTEHMVRVAAYSRRLGREMGLRGRDMLGLEIGSLLHDVGKVCVRDAVLLKPGRLTDEEEAEMQAHAEEGERMLRELQFPEDICLIAGQHHERWDGRGYPRLLGGERIDRKARVFAVVDTFDAMTADRVYRKGRPYEVARDEIVRCSGTQFDPEVTAAFCRVPPDDWELIRESCEPAPDRADPFAIPLFGKAAEATSAISASLT